MRVLGKIVRISECPIGRSVPCDQCPNYIGWGAGLNKHRGYIYCNPRNIIDAAEMEEVLPT